MFLNVGVLSLDFCQREYPVNLRFVTIYTSTFKKYNKKSVTRDLCSYCGNLDDELFLRK